MRAIKERLVSNCSIENHTAHKHTVRNFKFCGQAWLHLLGWTTPLRKVVGGSSEVPDPLSIVLDEVIVWNMESTT